MTTFELLVPDGDVPLAVRVHRPEHQATTPAIVVTGSWLTVKEQMPDTYARLLADRGYTAVTFDFAGFGASGGGLRQTEIPVRKMGNLAAVVTWLGTISGVDPNRLGVLSVCASAQYTLGALARGLPVGSFVSVAGWFHDTGTVAPFYGGPDGVADRLARADRALAEYTQSGGMSLVPAYAADDDRAAMSLPMDYYADPERGRVPEWRNEMSELSWGHWLTYDAFAAVPGVSVPTLFVHSDDAVLPDNVKTIAGRMGELASVEWSTGEQTDFYDQSEQVERAVESADRHFSRTLGVVG